MHLKERRSFTSR